MITTVERVLAQRADVPGLEELQKALTRDAEEPLLLHGFRGERAAIDRLFENLQSGVATRDSFPHGFGGDSGWDRLVWWHYRGWLPGDRACSLMWTTRCVELAKLPVHEQIAPFRKLEVPSLADQKILSHLLLENLTRVAEIHWRSTVTARCAVVGIACERFRQQHRRWPESPNELVPALLPAVPLDPFDGAPLRYTKSEEGVAVFSVGKRQPTQLDRLVGVKKPAPVPALPEGIEFGFRLWNPDQRRLPPRPDPPETARVPRQ
jgi:hypothetical protein